MIVPQRSLLTRFTRNPYIAGELVPPICHLSIILRPVLMSRPQALYRRSVVSFSDGAFEPILVSPARQRHITDSVCYVHGCSDISSMSAQWDNEVFLSKMGHPGALRQGVSLLRSDFPLPFLMLIPSCLSHRASRRLCLLVSRSGSCLRQAGAASLARRRGVSRSPARLLSLAGANSPACQQY